MISFASCQPQQLFTPLTLPLSRPANFPEEGREGAEWIGVAVWVTLGEGDGFEGGGQGFERAGDPRGWWPTPGGGEGLGSAWVGAALLAAVGRVIPGRQGCRELLEVKPGGKGSVFRCNNTQQIHF